MEHFPLAICDFQTTFVKTRIKATEVSILTTYAGHLKYWRYGKYRDFRLRLILRQKIPELFTRNSRVLPYRQYFKWPADVANIDTSVVKKFRQATSNSNAPIVVRLSGFNTF